MPTQENDKNDTIIMMLGYLCVATEIESSIGRKIEILTRFGLQDKQMASICGVKPQAIRDARQRAKKKR